MRRAVSPAEASVLGICEPLPGLPWWCGVATIDVRLAEVPVAGLGPREMHGSPSSVPRPTSMGRYILPRRHPMFQRVDWPTSKVGCLGRVGRSLTALGVGCGAHTAGVAGMSSLPRSTQFRDRAGGWFPSAP